MIDVKYFDQAVSLMDDEIREEIHRSGEYDGNPDGFLREYERRHLMSTTAAQLCFWTFCEFCKRTKTNTTRYALCIMDIERRAKP